MSVEWVPMEMAHVLNFKRPNPRDIKALRVILEAPYVYKERMVNEWSWSGISDGEIIVVAGINPHRDVIWAFLRDELKREMLALTRFGRSMTAAYILDVGPVWADIDETYAPAVRWIEQLYFRKIRGGIWVRDTSTIR